MIAEVSNQIDSAITFTVYCTGSCILLAGLSLFIYTLHRMFSTSNKVDHRDVDSTSTQRIVDEDDAGLHNRLRTFQQTRFAPKRDTTNVPARLLNEDKK